MKKIAYLILLFTFFLYSCERKESLQKESIKKIELGNDINEHQILTTIYDEEESRINRKEPVLKFGDMGNRTLNINDFFDITIPDNIELIYIHQMLGLSKDFPKYCIKTTLYVIYQNKFFDIIICNYGNTNKNILNGIRNFNLEKYDYFGPYNVADQIKYLKQNYISTPVINPNNVQFGRFVSNWPSGITSDYYGIYFSYQNDDFSECIISINNIWGRYGKANVLTLNDINYKEKFENEEELINLFNLVEIMESSITFSLSENSINIFNGYPYAEYNTDRYLIVPSFKNIYLKDQPNITGNNIEYMGDQIYEVLLTGEAVEIEEINGNWLLVKPFFGNKISWVFSGYTRTPTDEEIFNYNDRG